MSLWVNVRLERSAYIELAKFRNQFQVVADQRARKKNGCGLAKQLTLSDALDELIGRVRRHQERGKKPRKRTRKLYLHEADNEATRATGQDAGVPQSPGETLSVSPAVP